MSQKYEIGDLIEIGSFSEVYKFINKKNSYISAGKIFSLENYKKSSYIIEENILKFVNHPNIIKYKESFSDDKNHYIITDYYPNGNLKNLCKNRENKLTEPEIKYYVSQMVSALIYLKKNNIVHRDIKPHHFVISDDMKIKLCGFHVAKQLEFEKEKIKGNSGTASYKAPELVSNEYYSFEVDVWSLGITIFSLFFGSSPFVGKTKEEIYEKIKFGKYSFPKECDISPIAKDLIKRILITDTSRRLTIEEVYSHEFLKFGIPKTMPLSTLKKDPPIEFIIEYSQEKSIKENTKENIEEIKNLKKKLENVNNLLLKEKKISQLLSDKVKLLEGQLKEEKNKNKELIVKSKEIEEIKNNASNKDNIMNLMNKLLLKEEEIQEMKSRYPFEILKGEKLMSLIFISNNQEIHYSIICKDSDKFTNVENLLYDEYPKYGESENFFISEGNKINKYKTLKENNLKNGSIVMLFPMNEED